MTQMTQYQQFQASHRRTHDTLQHATWMAGKMGDNPNPMSWDEVKSAAAAGKPYSWAFQMLVDAKENVSRADREIEAATQEDQALVAA